MKKQRREEKNKRFKAHWAIFLVVAILCISSVSALDLTHTKSYDEETKTVTIKSFPLVGRDISTIQLKTPQVYEVPVGYQKVAEFEIDLFDDTYTDAFDKMEFYNNLNEEKIERQFDYKYLATETIIVDDYDYNCYLNVNGTTMCNPKVIGTHEEYEQTWESFDTKELVKGKVTIGIFTEVYLGDNVEWIPTLFGKEIDEWASFVQTSGTETIDGAYTVVTFTSDGTFNVSVGTLENVEMLFVAGGGGGGGANSNYGGGGGAGGILYNSSVNLTTGNYNVVVGRGGAGGIGAVGSGGRAWNGTNSSLIGGSYSFIAVGGGGGGSGAGSTPMHGADGGSGGGSGGDAGTGGASSQDNTSGRGYGFAGAGGGDTAAADGGGGAGEVGNLSSGNGNSGYGGNGITFNITNGTELWYAGGGGGGAYHVGILGTGGLGGGGKGGRVSSSTPVAGINGSGGGGGGYGGVGTTTGAVGGNGIVILRYLTPAPIPTTPIVTLNTPIDVANLTTNNINFGGVVSDNFEVINVSLIIDDVYLSTNSSGINNSNYTFLQFAGDGDHTWTYEACDNASQCTNGTARTFSITKIILNNQSFYNTTTYETAIESFTSNITYTSSVWDSISASLNYGGTQYSSTSSGSGNELNFTSRMTVPLTSNGIIPIYWNYTLTNATGSYVTNGSRINQTSNLITLIGCNGTYADIYLNFTFKDEGNLTHLKGIIPTSTFKYTLQNWTINKTLTFINTTANTNQTICFDPPNRTIMTAFELQYRANGYQQRIIDTILNLTIVTTNETLYLLANADGLFVTFQIINLAEQAIEGAIINATRVIEGATQILGQGISNAAGSVTFWLNPDFEHVINVAATSFPFFTTTLFPTQTSYTISLGSSTGGGIFDFTKGITYSLTPSGTFIDPDEIETFDFNLTSDFWTVNEFGYSLENEDGISYSNQTLAANGGGVTSRLNVTDNKTITMRAYWLITGNYTNVTRSWTIYNETLDDDWSIKNFFTDLNNYVDDGLFGLDDFGLAIILFFAIFIITGVMSWRFGLTSAPAISALLFTLVAFFDVGLNMMNNFTPIDAFNNFPTIMMGLILVATLIREGLR